MQILKEEEDAKPLARCEEKKKEWAKHWQCGKEVQNQDSKRWYNEELKKLEEDLPGQEESDLANAAKIFKTKTGVGCDGFSPGSPTGFEEESGLILGEN